VNAITLLGRGSAATAILVWCVLFLCVPEVFSDDQLARAQLRCDARSQVGDITVVQFDLQGLAEGDVHLRGVSESGPPILLTPAAGERLFDLSGKAKRIKTYFYSPKAPGDIEWRLRVGEDELSCRTRVLAGKSDDHEEEEEKDDEGGGGGGTGAGINLIALHDSSSRQYDDHCNDCHADVHRRESLDPTIPTVHRVMAPFAPGRAGSDRQCRSCHSTVDLTWGSQRVERSTGNLRRHVDVALCALCHGPRAGGASAKFYQADPFAGADLDGERMYRLICSGCHGPLADSEVHGESAGDIREAIADNEGGMRPLRILTRDEIQAIATALDR